MIVSKEDLKSKIIYFLEINDFEKANYFMNELISLDSIGEDSFDYDDAEFIDNFNLISF